MNNNDHREESHLQHLRKNLKGLTFEQKIDHIFRYYWGTLLILILIPISLAFIIGPMLKGKPDFVFTGNFCNVTLTHDGASYLINDWSKTLNMDSEDMDLSIKFSSTAGMDANDVDGGVQVAAAVAAQNLDYIVCDDTAVEYFVNQGAFLPVEQILDEEVISQWSDKIYTYTDEADGITYNAALDVTDTPFFRDSIPESGKVYFFFANKENIDIEILGRFFEHILSWEYAPEAQ